MLNNITHKDLRVINRYGAEFGDNVGTVLTVPTEYEEIQREYPIFFRKDPATGEYQSIVLLGFSKDENLFLDGDRWDASYVPGIVARGPFLIGFQRRESGGETHEAPIIHVDLDHPRVSQTEGLPIFKPQGGNSPYLDRVASILNGIREGLELSKAMFAAYAELDLIEPVKVEVKTNAEETYSLLGLHTLNHEKLAALDGASLEKLNKAGFLRGAYLVIASVGNVRRLMERKERKRAKLENPA
jgi:hypothetical protein